MGVSVMFLGHNDFSLYIDILKAEMQFDTYLETITYYIENETDVDYANVAKNLNQKIIENLKIEAREAKMLKNNEEVLRLM